MVLQYTGILVYYIFLGFLGKFCLLTQLPLLVIADFIPAKEMHSCDQEELHDPFCQRFLMLQVAAPDESGDCGQLDFVQEIEKVVTTECMFTNCPLY